MSEPKYQKNAIAFVKSQTDYDDEEIIKRMDKWNGDCSSVIREYLNPNFNKKSEKVKTPQKININQTVLREYGKFMDTAEKQRKERKKQKEMMEMYAQKYNEAMMKKMEEEKKQKEEDKKESVNVEEIDE